MSATLDAEVFSNYFGGPTKCPVLSVEGRTFPVTDVYLEDILRQMEYVPDHKVRVSGLKADELEQRMNTVREGLDGEYPETVIHSLATINPSVIDFKLMEALIWSAHKLATRLLLLFLADEKHTRFPPPPLVFSLVFDMCAFVCCIRWIIDHRPAGGILVFLPGVYEITKLCGNLERTIPNRETREKYCQNTHARSSHSQQWQSSGRLYVRVVLCVCFQG